MSEWGLIAFHYDYEAPDRRGKMRRHRGLVSRAYKYPGVPAMILHAYSGLKYFFRLLEGENHGPDMFRDGNCIGLHSNLNTAFDVFFDYGCIQAGADTVSTALLKEDTGDLELKNTLFNCEGFYGWLFAEYTGNPVDGYKLRYGYFYGKGDDEYMVGDVRRALNIDMRIHDAAGESIPGEFENALSFFDENAVLFDSEEEFWGLEDRGAQVIKDYRKE
jgi:hypothetical protein